MSGLSVGSLLAYFEIVGAAAGEREIMGVQRSLDLASTSAVRMGTATEGTEKALAGAGREANVAATGTGKYRAAQLSAVAAVERYNTVLADESASIGKVATAQASLIRAQDRVVAASPRATAAVAATGAAATKSAEAQETAAARSTKALATIAKTSLAVGAVLGYEALKQAGSFQQATNVYVTAAGESQKNLGLVRNGILKVAKDTGTGVDNLTSAEYLLEKAGLHGASGLKLLGAAAQGAREENANLSDVVQGATSIFASYHLNADQSVQVINALKTGAGEAKVTMEEYVKSLSTVIPVASAAGLSLDQTLAAISTLTQHGTSADEATQELANTIRNLQAPNNVASKAMQQLGLDVNTVSLNLSKKGPNGGLTGTIDMITKAISTKMGPSGLVAVSAFKKSQSASADLTLELSKMPKHLADISQQFSTGKLSYKDYYTDVKNLGGQQFQLGKGFLATSSQAQGFNDLLRTGSPQAQTFASYLKRVTGGANGLNTALQLGGENLAGFQGRAEAVNKSLHDTSPEVEGWASTQGLFSVQTDRAKETLHALVIELGEHLLPAGTKVMSWFADHGAADAEKFGKALASIATTAGTVLREVFGFLASHESVVIGVGGAVAAMWLAFKGYKILMLAKDAVVGYYTKLIAMKDAAAAYMNAEAEMSLASRAKAASVELSAAQQTAAVKLAAAEQAEAYAQSEASIAASLAGTDSILAESAAVAAASAKVEAASARSAATAATTAASQKEAAAIAAATIAQSSSQSVAVAWLQAEGADARAAANIAVAESEKANAAADAAIEIAAAVEGTNSVLAEGAVAAANAAIDEAASFEAAALAATTAATTIEAAATAAADTIVTEGEVAGAGWTAMLGPVGLIGVGIAGAITAFGLFGKAAHAQIKPTDEFTNAILNDNDALGANTRAVVKNSLEKAGLYDVAAKLHISEETLTNAMLGNKAALAEVSGAQLKAYADGQKALNSHKSLTKAQKDEIDANAKLSDGIGDITKVLAVNKTAADHLAAADGKVKKASDDTTAALAAKKVAASLTTASLKDLANLRVNPKISADPTQAKAATKLIQSEIDGIKQSKNPKLNADSKLGKAAITNLQAQINALTGKLITVEVQAVVGSVKSAGKGSSTSGHTYASGGGVADGWFTVGEEGGPDGWELGHKSGSKVDIYSNRQAKRMTGMNHLPGYAQGTLNDGGFKKSLGKDAATEKTSFDSLLDIGTRAGISSGLSKHLKAENKKLDADINARNRIATKLDSANQRLADAQKALAAEAAAVSGAITGSFDITSAGTGSGGDKTPTFNSIHAEGSQDLATIKEFVAGIEKLSAEGLNGTEVKELAEKGPSAWPQVKALLAATPAQIKSENSLQAGINQQGSALGKFIGNKFDGAAVANAQSNVNADKTALAAANKLVDHLGAKILTQLENGIRHLDSPKMTVYLDGKKIATAVKKGDAKNARKS